MIRRRGCWASAFTIICLLLFSAIPVGAVQYNYKYDNNGNLLTDGKYFYGYNIFNQLYVIRENNSTGRIIATYYYGPDGERLVKRTFLPNGSVDKSTYYVSDEFVRVMNSTKTIDTTYYHANGRLVASEDSNGEKRFYHVNALGSTSVVTDASGNIVEELSYAPFGEMLEQSNKSRYTFTGQERDPEAGLMYYVARYYNPATGRFTQPDTIIQDIYDPQTLNRYAYARNNPLKYEDPSGNFFDIIFDIGFLAWDIYDIVKDPFSATNWISGGIDLVSAFIPGVTGLGAAYKASSKAVKIAKSAEKASKLTKAASKAENVAEAASKAAKTGGKATESLGKVFEKESKNKLEQNGLKFVGDGTKEIKIHSALNPGRDIGEIDGLLTNGDIVEIKLDWFKNSPLSAAGGKALKTAQKQFNSYKYFQFQEGKGSKIYMYSNMYNPEMIKSLQDIGYEILEYIK